MTGWLGDSNQARPRVVVNPIGTGLDAFRSCDCGCVVVGQDSSWIEDNYPAADTPGSSLSSASEAYRPTDAPQGGYVSPTPLDSASWNPMMAHGVAESCPASAEELSPMTKTLSAKPLELTMDATMVSTDLLFASFSSKNRTYKLDRSPR